MRVMTQDEFNQMAAFCWKNGQMMKEAEFNYGPLSIQTNSVKDNTQVLILCRVNKRLPGRVRAFDEHFNMLLENVCEIWTEGQKIFYRERNEQTVIGKDKKPDSPVIKDRYIRKMFLRGDCVLIVVKNPVEPLYKKKQENEERSCSGN
ncbi:hypothetical protein MKW92_030484 [Papaver armeniacum]|nr:hypothetical protein MKW92_030484 [Papaver armeniacum]